MMRKILVLFIVIAILFLSSCQTSVTIDYMYPSDVNMSSYRSLAVMPVVPYRGSLPGRTWIRGIDVIAGMIHIRPSYSSYTLARDVADFASDELYSTLRNSGYFDLLNMDATASIVNSGYRVSERLRDAGCDAVMIPRIEMMDVDEYIFTRRHSDRVWDDRLEDYVTVSWYDYIVQQKASIRYSITIVDTRTERIVATRTFEDSSLRTESFDPDWPRFDSVELMFRRMIRGFNEGIRRQFTPTSRSYSVDLMKNKPEDADAERAYDAAADGSFREAGELFLSLWHSRHHVPSGYNAALIAAASGRFDESLSVLEEVMEYSSDGRVRDLYDDISVLAARNEEAESQYIYSEPDVPEDAGSGISVYDYLLR